MHGADIFTQSVRISDEVIDQIAALDRLAPLHNEPACKIIRMAQTKVRSGLPMFRFPTRQRFIHYHWNSRDGIESAAMDFTVSLIDI